MLLQKPCHRAGAGKHIGARQPDLPVDLGQQRPLVAKIGDELGGEIGRILPDSSGHRPCSQQPVTTRSTPARSQKYCTLL